MYTVKYSSNYTDPDGDMMPTYYIKEKLSNGQTIFMALELYDERDCTNYWNVYLTIYNKRKHTMSNLDAVKSTGKNPFESASICRTMFKDLVMELLKSGYNRDCDNMVTITWTDNRRRDVYYRYLHRFGYEYGTVYKSKVIQKKYPRYSTEV